MADEPAAEAAAEAAAAVTERIETVQEAAEAAIATAQQNTERAEEAAAQLAAAAMETERGNRITALENQVSQCQTEMGNLRMVTENLNREILELKAPASVAVISPAPAKSSLIPQVSEAPVEVRQAETTVTEVVPAESVAAHVEAQTQPHKRRRLL